VTPKQGAIRVLVFPRDENPYMRLLYGELRELGVESAYLGTLTRSHTVNLLLLPFELVARRLRGWNVLHLHWVFGFSPTGAERLPLLRVAAQRLFGFILWLARRLGLCIAWTAHNVLPHEQVFADDRAARRTVVRAADIVFVHSTATVDALEEIGAAPTRWTVVPHGPFERPTVASRAPGQDAASLHVAFVGRIVEYKGVEDLVSAASALTPETPLRVTIAGAPDSPSLAQRLRELAAEARVPIDLQLRFLPDDELSDLLTSADVVALPFRRITTSGSVHLAMGHGRVVLIPDLPAFDDIPRDSVVRYDGTVEGLTRSLDDLAAEPRERLVAIGERASAYTDTLSWSTAAQVTRDALEACVS
jgi:glycosyltransferase involved in cell wall biosynthesis